MIDAQEVSRGIDVDAFPGRKVYVECASVDRFTELLNSCYIESCLLNIVEPFGGEVGPHSTN